MENCRPTQSSYGQISPFTIVDRIGILLSERRVRKFLRKADNRRIDLLDIGCGFYGRMLKQLAPFINSGVGVDVAVAESVKVIPNIRIIEKAIEDSIRDFDGASFDIVLLISVLEHIEDPLFILKECGRILKQGGFLLINVPTWRGKFFLEISAFKLGLSPKKEIDDHKMYYDKKDLWPLLVKAGFKPSSVEMSYYKLGLNLFAGCKKQ